MLAFSAKDESEDRRPTVTPVEAGIAIHCRCPHFKSKVGRHVLGEGGCSRAPQAGRIYFSRVLRFSFGDVCSTMYDTDQNSDVCSTGIEGLDQILMGGLPRGRLYLLEGSAGVGKTTLAMQFLLAGVRAEEKVLYILTAETRQEVAQAVASHGWTFQGVDILELQPSDEIEGDEQYTVFHPSEVQLDHATKILVAEIDRLKPTRVVLDSITGLRLLAQSSARYRQQVMLMKRAFARNNCTVLLLDDLAEHTRDLQLRSVVHGVISLHRTVPKYGAVHRQLEVGKLRGVDFRGGYHDFAIRRGGIVVFPRIIIADHRREYAPDITPSGLGGLDAMLGGGLSRGSSTVIMGPAGVGKSSLAARYALAAAERGSMQWSTRSMKLWRRISHARRDWGSASGRMRWQAVLRCVKLTQLKPQRGNLLTICGKPLSVPILGSSWRIV